MEMFGHRCTQFSSIHISTRLDGSQSMWQKCVSDASVLHCSLPPCLLHSLQVLRYGPTNKYGAHMDALGRVCSVLIYLVAPEEGGETAFPQSNGWVDPRMGEPTQGNFSACAKGHVAYRPRR